MKRLFLITILAFVLFFSISAFAADDVIFIASSGDDNAVGTAEAPLGSIYAAFRALPYGGTIVICDAMTVESIEFPASKGNVTITSVYGGIDYRNQNNAALTLNGNVYLKSSVKFENINIFASKSNLNIVCNGNHTVFGEGINLTTTSSSINYPLITAGAMGLVGADGGYVEIHSGTFSRIYGGSAGTNSAAHSGDTTIAIYGGTFNDVFYMTGVTALKGDTKVYIYGGTFNKALVGAAVSDISGNLYVSVYGGTFASYLRPVTDGKLGGNCTLNIFGGNVAKIYNVYTGSITGTLNINVAEGITLTSCPFETNTVSNTELAKIKSSDASAISAASAEKYPVTAENPLESRNNEYNGSTAKITRFEKAVPGGDLNNDEKITLLDVLTALKIAASDNYIQAADINEDNTISVPDFLAILKSAVNDGELITEYYITNSISDTLNLYGNATASENTVSNGYAFGTTENTTYTLHSNVKLEENAVVGLYFGCEDATPSPKNGYYFEVNTADKSMSVYKIIDGSYRVVAERKLNLLSNEAEIKVVYGKAAENSAALYFNDNPLVTEHFFDFDLAFELKGSGVGLYVENAVATLPIVTTEIPDTSLVTYTNPLIGNITDPEVYYEDGVYYIYGTKSGGVSDGVQCFTTSDFVTFESRGVILAKKDAYGDKSIVAANIVKQGDIYYMFYLQESTELGINTTAFATASSPLGPFVTEEKVPLVSNTDIIGGQPFVDDDGTVYLVYTRTTGGNKTYVSKVNLSGGKAELDLTTEAQLLVPTEDWEYAKASVVECGFILKHGGTYYLLYAGGNYNSTYGVGYATSDNIYGPYTKYEYNPILWSNDQAFGNGAASTFPSPDGKEHFIIYLRNNSPTVTRPLNTCIDRIRFVPNPNGGNDILEIAGASVNPQPLPSGIGKIYDIDYQTSRWHW